VGESNRSKGVETREFWKEAIRLWADSGLSVREFCRREGLTEHSFYSWRRELLPEKLAAETSPTPPGKDGHRDVPVRRRQRRRRQVSIGDASDETVAASFVELAAPMAAERCHCELELESTDGAKMRIQLTNAATPDVAAICQSFWNGGNSGNRTS
jgi:transposase-like protein